MESDGSSSGRTSESTDNTRYTYVWGPDRIPLALEVSALGQPSETYAYHTDALGSVVAMTDESGSVVVRATATTPTGP